MRLPVAASRRGFTLVELMVVLSVLAILMGILFPVFVVARRSALASSCLNNFRQASLAVKTYMADYDDHVMPANHRPGEEPNAALDMTWPQILLPYVRDFRVFDCPADPTPFNLGGAFDPDLIPGDYAGRYYQASLHADLGYNSYYLAPVVRQGDEWIARTRTESEVGDPSKTLLFIESRADGGGSYLVAPPCRYIADHNRFVDTFLAATVTRADLTNDPLYVTIDGWDLSGTQSAYPFGGVGVRHGNHLNVSRMDGSAKSVTLSNLLDGCQPRPGWRGAITNPERYPWYDSTAASVY